MLPVGKGERAFSLLELTLVLLLLGVSLLIVAPNISKGLDDRKVRGSALGLAAAARDLRSRALSDGMPQELVVNSLLNSYLVGRMREVRLPDDVKFVGVEGGESLDRDRKKFYFFPNGSSLGGEIILADSNQSNSYYIRVEPLTGKIEVSRGSPS